MFCRAGDKAFDIGIINFIKKLRECSTPGNDADFGNFFRLVSQNTEFSLGREFLIQKLCECQGGGRFFQSAGKTDFIMMICAEGLKIAKRNHAGDEGVVADERICVERQMNGVEGNAFGCEKRKTPGMNSLNSAESVSPADTVMDENEIGVKVRCDGEKRFAGVDRKDGFSDFISSLKLKSVVGGIVRIFTDFEDIVKKYYEQIVACNEACLRRGKIQELFLPWIDTHIMARGFTRYLYGLHRDFSERIIAAGPVEEGQQLDEMRMLMMLFVRGITTERGRVYIDAKMKEGANNHLFK